MKEYGIRTKESMDGKRIGIILALAFTGWALCGMIMGIGMATTTLENALVIHALFVPVVFFTVSFIYYSKLNYTTPLETAGIFIIFVILMDFFVVSLMINKNFDMFKSILGTWFVFAEIFITTYLTGRIRGTRTTTVEMISTGVHYN